MSDLFKDAKFGDKYLTLNNQVAIFIAKHEDHVSYIVQGQTYDTAEYICDYDGKGLCSGQPAIISKYDDNANVKDGKDKAYNFIKNNFRNYKWVNTHVNVYETRIIDKYDIIIIEHHNHYVITFKSNIDNKSFSYDENNFLDLPQLYDKVKIYCYGKQDEDIFFKEFNSYIDKIKNS